MRLACLSACAARPAFASLGVCVVEIIVVASSSFTIGTRSTVKTLGALRARTSACGRATRRAFLSSIVSFAAGAARRTRSRRRIPCPGRPGGTVRLVEFVKLVVFGTVSEERQRADNGCKYPSRLLGSTSRVRMVSAVVYLLKKSRIFNILYARTGLVAIAFGMVVVRMVVLFGTLAQATRRKVLDRRTLVRVGRALADASRGNAVLSGDAPHVSFARLLVDAGELFARIEVVARLACAVPRGGRTPSAGVRSLLAGTGLGTRFGSSPTCILATAGVVLVEVVVESRVAVRVVLVHVLSRK